ncbi:PRP38 family-domain-containing protein, partial [Phlyctochytrium arcticum]
MANQTTNEASNIHGTNPQFLIEKIIRTRIYDSFYWKESCFALTAETIIDKAASLNSIGGQYGNQKPTEFLCLALKLLQLQPEKEIVRLYIQNEDYKYLRALGAFYLRLTGSTMEVYQYLEPLLLDFRKLRKRKMDGQFELTHMDEFVDELLTSDRVCDTILPRITKRHILERNGDLEMRISPLEDDLEEEEIIETDKEEEGEAKEETVDTEQKEARARSNSRYRDRSVERREKSPRRRSSVDRRRSRSRSRRRDRSLSYESRRRSRTPDRSSRRRSSRDMSYRRSRHRSRRRGSRSYSRSPSRSPSRHRSRSRSV